MRLGEWWNKTVLEFTPNLCTGPTGQICNLQWADPAESLVPLPGGAQAVYGASGILYYGHPDHLGSIRLGSTSSRTVSFDVAYAPFGEPYASAGSIDPAFTGQREDTVSGLYDFPATEYNPQGRWPSADPAGLVAFNRYAYARNTPLSVLHPSGMLLVDDCADICDDGGGVSDPGGVGDPGAGVGQSGPTSGGDIPVPPDIGTNPSQDCGLQGCIPISNSGPGTLPLVQFRAA